MGCDIFPLIVKITLVSVETTFMNFLDLKHHQSLDVPQSGVMSHTGFTLTYFKPITHLPFSTNFNQHLNSIRLSPIFNQSIKTNKQSNPKLNGEKLRSGKTK